MKGRVLLVAGLASLCFAVLTASASAAIVPNPWLSRHFMNIAHQGGEDEVPSNTMYALKSAVSEAHADMLELDVHVTADGVVVVSHDDTFTRIGCLPALCVGSSPAREDSQIRDMTYAELAQIDAGYWFRPGTYSHDFGAPDSAFPFRGIRTGDKPPPAGYTAEDFKIPTMKSVLDAFPNTPINIEIKMPKSIDPPHPYSEHCGTADGMGPSELCDDLDLSMVVEAALADLLDDPPYSTRDDLIVVSFAQEPMVQFATDVPQIGRAPSQPALTDYVFEGQPLNPDPVAFQVPPQFGGILVPELLLGPAFKAHENGYAVHVFTENADDETPAAYQHFYDIGVDGVMTTSPRKLDAYLCSAGIPHPDGAPRCPAATPVPTKKCKKGKKKKGKSAAEAKGKKKKKHKKCGKKKKGKRKKR